MRTKGAEEGCTLRQNRGKCLSGNQDTQRAFAVISILPPKGSVPADAIKAKCEGIQGLGAIHVDADRGKIHVLYDGTMSAIAQLEQTLNTLGLRVRNPAERPSS